MLFSFDLLVWQQSLTSKHLILQSLSDCSILTCLITWIYNTIYLSYLIVHLPLLNGRGDIESYQKFCVYAVSKSKSTKDWIQSDECFDAKHGVPVVCNIKWYCTAHYSAVILNALNVKALNDHCIYVYVDMTCNNAEM